jgi:hypothetical protein
MYVKQFYQEVALKHYQEWQAEPTSYHKLWSTLVSANTIADHLGVEVLNYGSTLTRQEIDGAVSDVRQAYPDLQSLDRRVSTLKHVRRHERGVLTQTSTGILPDDPTTWHLNGASGSHDLGQIAERIFATFRAIPELNSS